MEKDQFNPYPDAPQPLPKRPVFLTVLCIITFIFSGLGTLMGLLSLASGSQRQSQTQLEETYETLHRLSPGFADQFMDIMDISTSHHTPMTLLGLVVSISCLFGAFLMFRLDRKGFYIYTSASILSLIYPYFFFGYSFLWMSITIFVSLFILAFILMYRANLKYMK